MTNPLAAILIAFFFASLALGEVRATFPLQGTPSTVSPSTIRLTLDPLDRVPGFASAWETLDELVLDAASVQRIGDAKLIELLAAGLTIVAADTARPGGSLPWQRERDAWALPRPRHGAGGGMLAPAMLPAAGPQPGTSAPFRRNTLLAAALFSILATGAALCRTKHATLAVAAIVVLSVVAAHAWKSNQPAVPTIGGVDHH